jgi:Ras-related protein Rab-1A/Rab family protein
MGEYMSQVEGLVYKLLLVGESGVGKTSLVKQFVYKEFDDIYTKTLGANLYKKEIDLEVGGKTETAKLMVWDLFGDNLFQGIMKSAFNGAEGIIFVSDLTNVDTLWKLDIWINSAFRFGSESAFVFLGNKSDLKERQFDDEEIDQFAQRFRGRAFITSAKTGDNVEAAFQAIGQMILDREFARRFVAPDTDHGEEIPKLVEVEDKIMDTFCHGVGEYVEGMTIVQSVFKELDIDFENPTADQLHLLVQRLLHETKQGLSPDDHKELDATLRGYLKEIKL